MPAISHKLTVLLGLLVIATAAYCLAGKQQPRATPIQELEAIVGRYELNYRAETNVQGQFVNSAEQCEIHVHPSWTRVEIDKDGNASIDGITAWNVSVVDQVRLADGGTRTPSTIRPLWHSN